MKIRNTSGIWPAANRVLVLPDPIDDELGNSMIQIPDAIKLKYQHAQASGTLIDVGPDAFNHIKETVYAIHENGERQLIEERFRGYVKPFAKVGERVAYAKYVGLHVKGEDGKRYLVLNDEDITCRISDNVEFTDLDTRKGTDYKQGIAS